MQTTINIPEGAVEVLREIIPDLNDTGVKEIFTYFINSRFEEEKSYCQPTAFDMWLEGDDAEHILNNYL